MIQKIRSHAVYALLLMMTSLFALYSPNAQAKPVNNSINLIPTIESISLDQAGHLFASGTVTAIIKGKTTTVHFTAVPVHIRRVGAGVCPILDLELGPIDLNLLGLVVETSPICLTVSSFGGDLGALLCRIGQLLDLNLNLEDILLGLTPGELATLLDGLKNLFNGALSHLVDAILTSIEGIGRRGTCAILHLALGPVDLTLLGLNFHLDNCANGPVTVDIAAKTGKGNLLGNLLCELLGGDLINVGATLQDILDLILGLLSV